MTVGHLVENQASWRYVSEPQSLGFHRFGTAWSIQRNLEAIEEMKPKARQNSKNKNARSK